MSIPNSRPLQRRPIHPGEILREDFMPDYDLTVSALAAALAPLASVAATTTLTSTTKTTAPETRATKREQLQPPTETRG